MIADYGDEERAAIVAWMRRGAQDFDARAETQEHPVQRERTRGNAFTLRFLAKQIEEGDHHRTKEEVQERFRVAWDISTPAPTGDTGG